MLREAGLVPKKKKKKLKMTTGGNTGKKIKQELSNHPDGLGYRSTS